MFLILLLPVYVCVFNVILCPVCFFPLCQRHSVSSDSGSGSSVQNRIGDGGGALSEIKVPSVSKVTDVRQLLEEKRQGHRAPTRPELK